MEIKVTLEETTYIIKVEPGCFPISRLGTIKEGKNAGQENSTQLCFPTTMSQAIKKIIQAHHADSDEILSLREYIERIEQVYADLTKKVDL